MTGQSQSGEVGSRPPALVAALYIQGFADHRASGTRNGPVHLFDNGLPGVAAICGRRVRQWNFEGETEDDFCPKCIRIARSRGKA